jgi:hypothetical protein
VINSIITNSFLHGVVMSNDKNKTEKQLQVRMKEFETLLKDEDKRMAWYDQVPFLIRFELFLPSPNPEEEADGLYLYIGENGEIVNSEYYFRDCNDLNIISLSDEEFKVVKELFNDFTMVE